MFTSLQNSGFYTKSYNFFIKNVHVRRKSYTSLHYCAEVVRSLDRENYFSTLLLPKEYRNSAFAIRAFNAEIATVQQQVTQENLGRMRMKYWKESIDDMYIGKIPNNPVCVELDRAVKRHKLSKKYLRRLILCREKRIGQVSFQSLKQMEEYAEHSCSTVLLLILQCANVSSVPSVNACVHVGIAQGLANMLRGLPHLIETRVLNMPSELLASYNVSEESVLRGYTSSEFREVTSEIASVAELHLKKARLLMEDVPSEVRPILLVTIPTEKYLNNLRYSGFNVFDGGIQKKDPFLPLNLFWKSVLKAY